jgi:hypothetical protein
MANEDLITLLQKLQGGGSALLPSLIDTAAAKATQQAASQSPAAAVASSAMRGLGGGLTLLPMVSGLLKLFGAGNKQDALPPLEKFEMPAPIRAEAGLNRNGETFLIDRGAGDRVRPLPTPTAESPAAGGPQPGASITVNVQAMDSQSFLDRREDIARAVREAMLQSHSLNDVVSEL